MLDMGPIEERLGTLESRPWQICLGYAECNDKQGCGQVLMRVEEEYSDQADLTFIAHAPEDIEALVAEVKMLRDKAEDDGHAFMDMAEQRSLQD